MVCYIMSVELNPRAGYVSNEQKKRLTEILELKENLRCGKFSNNFTKKEAQHQWEDFAKQLNSIPGGKKDWTQWRKTWQDMRGKAKKKGAAIARHARGTGGGPPMDSQLTPTEEKIVGLISEVSATGHITVSESTVAFNYDDIEVNVPDIPAVLEVVDIPFANAMEISTSTEPLHSTYEAVVSRDHDYTHVPSVFTPRSQIHTVANSKVPRTTPRLVAAKRLQNSVTAAETLGKESLPN